MILRNVSALLFADTEALAVVAEAAAEDPRLSRSRLEVHRGGVMDAAEWLSTNPSPDVLFISDSCDETCWDRFERLADNVEPHCRVVVLGPADQIAIYREMISRGVADYLGGELVPEQIVECLARLFVAEEGLPKGKMVAVLSAVGGAGGSTVAAVLAYSLSKRFGDAILLDMDLPTGTSALMMGVDPRDPLAAALGNPGLDAAMLERFMAREGAVRILSTAGALREARYVDAETIERLTTIARAMSKTVVVDMPKGWGDCYDRLTMIADEVVLVARPDLASLRNCRMIVEDVGGRRVDGKRPKIVLNGVGASKKNEYGTTDFAEAGGAVPTAMVPFDPDPLLTAIAEGRPIQHAEGKAMPALLEFADMIFAPEGARPAGIAGKKQAAKADPLASLKGSLSKLVSKKQKA